MKKIYLYLIVAVIIILIGIFFGTKIAGLLGIVAGGGAVMQKKKEEALKNVDEAGEKVEATKHDSDSALGLFDDFFSDADSEDKSEDKREDKSK